MQIWKESSLTRLQQWFPKKGKMSIFIKKQYIFFGTSKQTLSNRIESTGNFSSIEEFAQGSFNPSSFIKSTPKLGKDFSQAENERQDKRTQHNPHIQGVLLLGIVWKKVTSQLTRDTLYQQWTSWPKSNGCETKQRMKSRSHSICLPVGTKKAAGIFWRAHSVGNLFYGFLARSFRKGFLQSASFKKVEENERKQKNIFGKYFPRISVYHFLIFYRNSLFYAKIKK